MNAAVWLLLLVSIVLSLGTATLMRHVFRRYRAVRNRAGLTGAEVARALLDATVCTACASGSRPSRSPAGRRIPRRRW